VRRRFPLLFLFLRDLLRRRVLWVLVAIIAGSLTFNYYVAGNSEIFVSEGAHGPVVSAPEGSAETSLKLKGAFQAVAQVIDYLVLVFVTVLAVLVAPESRRNGTTQFLLSLPVSRLRIAAAQFGALAACITVALLIVHLGIGYAGWVVGEMSAAELVLAWIPLLTAAMLRALGVFALSTTLSTASTLVVMLIAPMLLTVATQSLMALPDVDVTPVVRLLEHAQFLFPDLGALVFWPRIWLRFPTENVPSTGLAFVLAHSLLSVGFWTALGFLLYRRHDFGSRNILR